MTSADNSKDNTMKFICKAVVKGAQPLASIWATLTELEYHIQEDTGVDESEDKKIACPGGFSINVSDLLRQLELAVKVLGMAHVQGCQKRRLDLRDKINNSGKNWLMLIKSLDLNSLAKISKNITDRFRRITV